MANTITPNPNPVEAAGNDLVGGGLRATPQNYVSLGDLIDPTKPDVQDLYVATYGDQGITGFLELTGAKKNAGTSDEVEWYEEGRLHKTITGTTAAGTAPAGTVVISAGDVRPNDVLLTSKGDRLLVTSETNTAGTWNVVNLNGSDAVEVVTGEGIAIIGNIYAQGTNQPSEFYQTGLIKRENPYIITKEMYEVSGS